MRHRYLLLLLCSLLCTLGLQAQEEDTDILSQEEEELIGADSLETNPNSPLWQDSSQVRGLSTDEQWLYSLRERLRHTLQSHRTTKVTKTVGRGRRRRRVTQTVTRGYRVGVHVYDLTADSTLFAQNAHDLYIPASNQKIFVSTAALTHIGSDYHFTTGIYMDGHAATDTIPYYVVKVDTLGTDSLVRDTVDCLQVERPYWKGNIYLQGGFDPTLDRGATAFVAGKIMALGMDSIDGRIYCYEPQKQLTSDAAWFWNRHPSKLLASSLYQALTENGITFTEPSPYGTISHPSPFQGFELTTLSTPLHAVLQRVMKNSDNYYAESLLLNLHSPFDASHWSYEQCQQRVRDVVALANTPPHEYVIRDGSGLSHGNRCTPAALTDQLRYAYHHKDIFDPLYASLPIAGVDGTLRRRMKGSNAFANVRAKTGTVNGVSTLSGYAKASNGHLLAFSILVNNLSSTQVGVQLQNLLCTDMTE